MKSESELAEADRREFLSATGKFAVSLPPIMTMLLSTTMSSSAIAQSGIFTGKVHGNNGVGNGQDPQPPGNPPINDGAGTSSGNPGNKGGGNN